jgi:hypothetical protein
LPERFAGLRQAQQNLLPNASTIESDGDIDAIVA